MLDSPAGPLSWVVPTAGAAGAVMVVYLFMGAVTKFVDFLREANIRQEKTVERLTQEYGIVARDKAEVIHGVSTALENNTAAIKSLQETVRGLAANLEQRGKA